MKQEAGESFIITYLDLSLVTSITMDKVITFDIELFKNNERVRLLDHLNDSAFICIINKYNSELHKLSQRVAKRYRLSMYELLYPTLRMTLPSREILLKSNNRLLIKSSITKREYVTFIDSNIVKSNLLLNLHNNNIHFINTILYNKINKFITYLKISNRLIRLVILSVIFLLTMTINPLGSLEEVMRVGVYSLVFLLYPLLGRISSFIIRKLLNHLLKVVI